MSEHSQSCLSDISVQEPGSIISATIMHDYPDEKAVNILNIISALGYDSLILIGDMVIPATRTHWYATQVDITMMSVQLVENERWNSGMSLGKAGFKCQPSLHLYREYLPRHKKSKFRSELL